MKKIALNFIFKGTEEPYQIVRMLSSAAPYVDGIYATATWDEKGRAVEVAKSFGAHISFFKWIKDFAAARNFALKQVPDDYEYILWLDHDDVLVGGEHIRRYLELDKDRYFITYNYQIDKKTDAVLIKHPKERIFRKSLFEWRARLHETPVPLRQNISQMFIPDIVVNHLPTDENIKEGEKRNIEILEEMYKEEGDNHDPRTLYYLGRSYFDANNFPKAEKMFWEYLAGKNPSGWDEERAMVYNYLGIIYTIFKKYDDARSCFHMAMDERPEFPTWYINLGYLYGQMEDWDKALFWTTKGLQLPQPKTAMVLTPRDDMVKALETIYFACMNKRKLKEAYAAAEKLVQLFPDDKYFQKRRDAAFNVMRWAEMSKNVEELVVELDQLDEKYKIRALLSNIPSTLDNAYIGRLKQRYIVPHKWANNSIVYYCGRALEEWDETSVEKGIGGSETAVIMLTRYFAKKGYKVTVYGMPFEEHTDEYGVEWKMYWRFNIEDEFNIFISWRNPTVFGKHLKAKLALLDCHDVLEPADFTKDRLDYIDYLMVKSNFQASLAPNVPKNKFIIIPNGLNLEFLPNKRGKYNPNRLIYSSSYDRGLEWMLKWGWPIIKKEIPKAELHIYYGWQLFDYLYKNHPERQMWKKKMVKLMKQDGVFDHGRIGQKELLAEKQKSLIHYYATDFAEIDNIAVRESAAVGCIPITTNFACLPERPYTIRIDGEPRDRRTQEKIALTIVDYMRHPEKLNDIREDFMKKARKESWEKIANRWIEVFKKNR